MARGNNLTVQQALERLQTDQIDDSCDEDEETEMQDEEFISTHNAEVGSSDSDTGSDEAEQDTVSAPVDAPSVSDTLAPQNDSMDLKARNGTVWKNITGAPNLGRVSLANVFSECPGPTSYCHRSVVHGSPYSALHLFIGEPMLRCVQKHTVNHGWKDDENFDLPLEQLESFIGLQIARGVLVGKNMPVQQLWSNEWGHPIFRKTMGRDRYQKIMKHLRLDNVRFDNWIMDNFCLISEVWNCFIENCKKCYVPNFDLTIDEQLFPCKTRCPFTQYMANKPDKFGIKFWLLADAQSKYLCNGKPYLGKDLSRPRCTDVPGDVCLYLLQPYYKKGYNVTTDNFFTSLKLAEELKVRKTTILGTIRKQRREVPNAELVMKDKSLHASEIFSSPSGCSLTMYKAKRKKVVCILSSTHRTVNVNQSHKKKLPETIGYYNKSKVGVDVLDQMAKYHTCKSSTRRWPVAVFFNIVDCACINAYIIYCLTTKSKLSRRQFLLELIKELCKPKDSVDPITSNREVAQISPRSMPVISGEEHQSRKRKQCSLSHAETNQTPSAKTAQGSAVANTHLKKEPL